MTDARTDDPAAFWASLTPSRRLALAKAAPKVAGAWVNEGDTRGRHFSHLWSRTLLSDGKIVADIDSSNNRYHALVYTPGSEIDCGAYSVLPFAQSACDAELIRLGYVLEGE